MALYPDISHWQTINGSWTQIKASCGFIIFKATQGTNFIDPKVSSFIAGAESAGLPYYLYTYLNRGGELAQAQYLVKTMTPKVGKYFRGWMLDVEEGNSAAGVQAALNYLKGLGKKAILYTMHAQYNTYKGVIAGRGPGVCWMEARYGKNNGSYSSAYPCHAGVDLHQYTSNGRCPGIAGNVDLSRLTGTKAESWFTGGATPAPSPAPAKKSNEQIAQEVIAGKWGNNPQRAQKLKAAGYDPATIQAIVNKQLGGGGSSKKSNEQIAAEVISGKWGNGAARVNALRRAGYDAEAIQRIVNQKLKAAPAKKSLQATAADVIKGRYGNGAARKAALKRAGYSDAEIKQIQAIVNKRL